MSYLLDTCVICEPTRATPSPRVLNWLADQAEETLFLSVLTLGEIRKGAALLPAGPKCRTLERWLEHDLPERFAGRVLGIDAEAADLGGRVVAQAERRGHSLATLDSLLAATALSRDLTLVTRNTPDFAASGAELLDPWE